MADGHPARCLATDLLEGVIAQLLEVLRSAGGAALLTVDVTG